MLIDSALKDTAKYKLGSTRFTHTKQQSRRKLAHNKFSYRLLNNKLASLCAVEWVTGWGTSPVLG